jgi:hypothetical protein
MDRHMETYQERVNRLRTVYRERFPQTDKERRIAIAQEIHLKLDKAIYFDRLWKEPEESKPIQSTIVVPVESLKRELRLQSEEIVRLRNLLQKKGASVKEKEPGCVEL